MSPTPSGMPSEGWFTVESLNVSDRTGIRKKPVETVILVEGSGIRGDAHAGLIEKRQVSMLAAEEIEASGAAVRSLFPNGLAPGDYAENITTRGVRLECLPVGTKIEIGGTILEVSQIGKECHAGCEIRRLVGDCVMPRKGIFVRVLKGGEIHREDRGHYRF